MVLTVHHLNNSRSQRILWLLEELGVQYDLKKYERDPKTFNGPQELKDLHPLHSVPLLQDGDTTVVESGPSKRVVGLHVNRRRESSDSSVARPADTPAKSAQMTERVIGGNSLQYADFPLCTAAPAICRMCGEGDGLRTGAVLEYILAEYGKGRLQPPTGDKADLLRYRFILHYAEVPTPILA